MKDEALMLGTDNNQNQNLHIDRAFAICIDMKTSTSKFSSADYRTRLLGMIKQKVSSKNATEAELIAADNETRKITQVKRFAEAQEFKAILNITF